MSGAEDQLGGVLRPRHLHQGRCHIGADYLDIATTQLLEEGAVLDQAVGGRTSEAVLGAHVHPDQLGVGSHGHPSRPADENGASRSAGQGDHHALLGRPGTGNAVPFPVVLELLVDAVGHPQQCQLAECGQVAGTKVVAEGGIDAFRRVDVAVGQSPSQCFGGHVDQLELVGCPHHPVGDRLPLNDAGDPLNDVVERLEVLQVDGGDHVDTGSQQLFYVLPPLGISGARYVGVGQLVDQGELRVASQQGIEVELLECLTAVDDGLSRQHLQIPQLLRRLFPTVRVDPADHDVGATLFPTPPFVKHGICFPHAWCCA